MSWNRRPRSTGAIWSPKVALRRSLPLQASYFSSTLSSCLPSDQSRGTASSSGPPKDFIFSISQWMKTPRNFLRLRRAQNLGKSAKRTTHQGLQTRKRCRRGLRTTERMRVLSLPLAIMRLLPRITVTSRITGTTVICHPVNSAAARKRQITRRSGYGVSRNGKNCASQDWDCFALISSVVSKASAAGAW